MAREIVLDTETTGFEPTQGHRLVEIGCLELENFVPTGRVFHTYINPERDVPQEAFSVHGLSFDFLKDHPPFTEVTSEFLDFIQDDPLVIHNAKFDMKFLNFELKGASFSEIPFERAKDTLLMARQKFPGSPASLDALCKRFGIDNRSRQKHGALIDAELLAQVYLELIGGKQPGLTLSFSEASAEVANAEKRERTLRPSRNFRASEEEEQQHQELIQKLEGALWCR